VLIERAMLAFLSILLLSLCFVLKTRAKRETGRTDIRRSKPLETTPGNGLGVAPRASVTDALEQLRCANGE